MDLAIGIIIGAAFTTIVKSLVDDIIMPLASVFTNGIDFSNLYIDLSGTEYTTLEDARLAGAATLNYGLFVNAALDFLIIAVICFFLTRLIMKIRLKADDPNDKAVPTSPDIALLTEIRDLLAQRKT